MNHELATTVITVAVLAAGCAAPQLPTAAVTIGDGVTFQVDVARTPAQQKAGLSGRDHLELGAGMLFRFEQPAVYEVWMADMAFPIDAAWISDGTIISVTTLHPCLLNDSDECPRTSSNVPVTELLEVTAGTLSGIPAGTTITIDTT